MVLPCCCWADGRLREHALSASGETRRTAQKDQVLCFGRWPGILGICLKSLHAPQGRPRAESESAVRLICRSLSPVVVIATGLVIHAAFPCHRRVLSLATI